MIKIHERDIRGRTKTGWLDSYHTYSFGYFRDPTRVGFRSLRVMNDDIVIPGAGFPTHPHADMEIVTIILDGALEHKDSIGTGSVIRPGEIQRMSAGTGIEHSEFNHSKDEPVHLLQIWIRPEQRGLEPGYEQVKVPANDTGGFTLVGDRKGSDGAITIHQDVKMLMANVSQGQKAIYNLQPGRGAFLHITHGEVTLNGETLKEGDGAEIEDIPTIELVAGSDAQALLIDMA
jgi:redox-sensitive bicupin YhaK (pirin superfamily)